MMKCWKTHLGLGAGLMLLAFGVATTHCAAPNGPGVANPNFHRNLANSTAKNIPADFSVKKGAEKNIKWSAPLGMIYAYGGAVVAGGKVFVGTNNDRPRDPAIKGDKGVLMCFRESDGKFLWQIVHDKLPDQE